MFLIDFTRSSNKILVFFILCLSAFLLAYLFNAVLVTDSLYYDYLGDQVAYERIRELLDFSAKWQWVGYLFIPLIYLLKFFIIAICLMTGVILFGYRARFKRLFHIAMIAEFVFLLPGLIKLVWFTWIHKNYSLEELQFFYPFSMLSWFGQENYEIWLHYPLQLINVFELSYWLMLSIGLGVLLKQNISKMFGLVAGSYGIGLLVWVVFITFLSIQYS